MPTPMKVIDNSWSSGKYSCTLRGRNFWKKDFKKKKERKQASDQEKSKIKGKKRKHAFEQEKKK